MAKISIGAAAAACVLFLATHGHTRAADLSAQTPAVAEHAAPSEAGSKDKDGASASVAAHGAGTDAPPTDADRAAMRATPPAQPAGSSEALIASLRKIAGGELAAGKFQCNVSIVETVTAALNVGDSGPNITISLREGSVKVRKDVVTELKNAGPFKVPTFDPRWRFVAATEAELRKMAGLLADSGLTAYSTRYGGNMKELRLQGTVYVDDQQCSLRVNLSNPADSKRVEELVALLKDFNGRPEK